MQENNTNTNISDTELLIEKYSFKAKGNAYKVLPFKLEYALSQEMKDDFETIEYLPSIETDSRMLTNALLSKGEALEVVSKWLNQYCVYGNEPMSLEKAIEHEWDTDDMTLFLLKVVGISG